MAHVKASSQTLRRCSRPHNGRLRHHLKHLDRINQFKKINVYLSDFDKCKFKYFAARNWTHILQSLDKASVSCTREINSWGQNQKWEEYKSSYKSVFKKKIFRIFGCKTPGVEFVWRLPPVPIAACKLFGRRPSNYLILQLYATSVAIVEDMVVRSSSSEYFTL